MRTLGSLANRIRSKNAGPFNLTIDIFCDTKDSYNRIKKEVTKKRISNVYKTKETKVLIFFGQAISFRPDKQTKAFHKYCVLHSTH